MMSSRWANSSASFSSFTRARVTLTNNVPYNAAHTIDLSIKNKVLFVRVDSDALRTELGYSKSLLLNNLNNVIGKAMLTDIVLC